mgnify:CR=1 FL=1
MSKEQLMKIRKALKDRKPAFRQQDSHKKKRVEKVWRRPRGLHSKIRHNKWSYPKRIQIGYKSPAEVRGLHPSGLLPIMVHCVADLKKIDVKTQGALIAGDVGGRKRVDIVKAAGAIRILNFEDTAAFLSEVANEMEGRKSRVADLKAKQAAKSQTKIKTSKEAKEEHKQKLDEKAKKDEEKKEKDKILTQKS